MMEIPLQIKIKFEDDPTDSQDIKSLQKHSKLNQSTYSATCVIWSPSGLICMAVLDRWLHYRRHYVYTIPACMYVPCQGDCFVCIGDQLYRFRCTYFGYCISVFCVQQYYYVALAIFTVHMCVFVVHMYLIFYTLCIDMYNVYCIHVYLTYTTDMYICRYVVYVH